VDFKKLVSTEDELRPLIGFPGKLVQNKVIFRLDEHCRNLISKSPFLMLATADTGGNCDILRDSR